MSGAELILAMLILCFHDRNITKSKTLATSRRELIAREFEQKGKRTREKRPRSSDQETKKEKSSAAAP